MQEVGCALIFKSLPLENPKNPVLSRACIRPRKIFWTVMCLRRDDDTFISIFSSYTVFLLPFSSSYQRKKEHGCRFMHHAKLHTNPANQDFAFQSNRFSNLASTLLTVFLALSQLPWLHAAHTRPAYPHHICM